LLADDVALLVLSSLDGMHATEVLEEGTLRPAVSVLVTDVLDGAGFAGKNKEAD